MDLNAPEIQPVAYHYLRASLEAIGARRRPILDDVAIAVSCLNAACATAVMNAHAAGVAIDRAAFSAALMESVIYCRPMEACCSGWALPRLAYRSGSTEPSQCSHDECLRFLILNFYLLTSNFRS